MTSYSSNGEGMRILSRHSSFPGTPSIGLPRSSPGNVLFPVDLAVSHTWSNDIHLGGLAGVSIQIRSHGMSRPKGLRNKVPQTPVRRPVQVANQDAPRRADHGYVQVAIPDPGIAAAIPGVPRFPRD